MGRILAIDYGHVKIGLALTDILHIIASPYKTIDHNGISQVLEVLRTIIIEQEVEKIVLGYPMGLSGQKTQKTIEVDKFREDLLVLGVDIVLWDESFSSKRAKDIMHKMGKKTGHNKRDIDKIAAQVVLADYLKSLG